MDTQLRCTCAHEEICKNAWLPHIEGKLHTHTQTQWHKHTQMPQRGLMTWWIARVSVRAVRISPELIRCTIEKTYPTHYQSSLIALFLRAPHTTCEWARVCFSARCLHKLLGFFIYLYISVLGSFWKWAGNKQQRVSVRFIRNVCAHTCACTL